MKGVLNLGLTIHPIDLKKLKKYKKWMQRICDANQTRLNNIDSLMYRHGDNIIVDLKVHDFLDLILVVHKESKRLESTEIPPRVFAAYHFLKATTIAEKLFLEKEMLAVINYLLATTKNGEDGKLEHKCEPTIQNALYAVYTKISPLTTLHPRSNYYYEGQSRESFQKAYRNLQAMYKYMESTLDPLTDDDDHAIIILERTLDAINISKKTFK